MNKDLTTLLFTVIIMTLIACGVPKDTLQHIQSSKKETVDFPVDYANLFPTPTIEQWDKDYNYYNRFITNDIKRTQMGLEFEVNGVNYWRCMPSARPYVQLDTATMITDSRSVIGEWRIVCSRQISYTDSGVYADKKIYRNSEVLMDDKETDAYLTITNDKFNLYAKEKDKTSFKKVVSKNYAIESKRFLMLYGASTASAAISFIGIDKQGHLIVNTYLVEERKIEGTYITYEAIMTQMIFKRII
jgi:hypothetical protein